MGQNKCPPIIIARAYLSLPIYVFDVVSSDSSSPCTRTRALLFSKKCQIAPEKYFFYPHHEVSGHFHPSRKRRVECAASTCPRIRRQIYG